MSVKLLKAEYEEQHVIMIQTCVLVALVLHKGPEYSLRVRGLSRDSHCRQRERHQLSAQSQSRGQRSHLVVCWSSKRLTWSWSCRQAVDAPPSYTISSADIHRTGNMFEFKSVRGQFETSLRPVWGQFEASNQRTRVVIAACIFNYWAQSNYWSGSLFRRVII